MKSAKYQTLSSLQEHDTFYDALVQNTRKLRDELILTNSGDEKFREAWTDWCDAMIAALHGGAVSRDPNLFYNSQFLSRWGVDGQEVSDFGKSLCSLGADAKINNQNREKDNMIGRFTECVMVMLAKDLGKNVYVNKQYANLIRKWFHDCCDIILKHQPERKFFSGFKDACPVYLKDDVIALEDYLLGSSNYPGSGEFVRRGNASVEECKDKTDQSSRESEQRGKLPVDQKKSLEQSLGSRLGSGFLHEKSPSLQSSGSDLRHGKPLPGSGSSFGGQGSGLQNHFGFSRSSQGSGKLGDSLIKTPGFATGSRAALGVPITSRGQGELRDPQISGHVSGKIPGMSGSQYIGRNDPATPTTPVVQVNLSLKTELTKPGNVRKATHGHGLEDKPKTIKKPSDRRNPVNKQSIAEGRRGRDFSTAGEEKARSLSTKEKIGNFLIGLFRPCSSKKALNDAESTYRNLSTTPVNRPKTQTQSGQNPDARQSTSPQSKGYSPLKPSDSSFRIGFTDRNLGGKTENNRKR